MLTNDGREEPSSTRVGEQRTWRMNGRDRRLEGRSIRLMLGWRTWTGVSGTPLNGEDPLLREGRAAE
jgi:hypothetical protein